SVEAACRASRFAERASPAPWRNASFRFVYQCKRSRSCQNKKKPRPRRGFFLDRERLVVLELRHALELVLAGAAQDGVIRIPLLAARARGRGGGIARTSGARGRAAAAGAGAAAAR